MDGSLPATVYRLLLCMTGALIAVLLVRFPLRYAFGSRIAYGIWLLVPIAVIGLVMGSLAPTSAFTPTGLPMQVPDVHLPWSSVPRALASSGQINWGILGWALGAVLFASAQWWQQYAFVRRLGVLRPMSNGAWMSESGDIGPAVIGVFPPRMVLPTDFYQRFTTPEQTFALAHESMHIRRRDPLVNFIVVILRSLFWFHPLVHLAIRYFRTDQELACDADVLGIHTRDLHHYASAILKGQLSNPALPVECRLDSSAAVSLKRRFRMLQTPLPHRGHRVLGVIIVTISLVISGGLVTFLTAQDRASADSAATQVAPHQRVNIESDITTINADSVMQAAPQQRVNIANDITLINADSVMRVAPQRRRVYIASDITTINADSVMQVAPVKP